jgi:hypothetical protein
LPEIIELATLSAASPLLLARQKNGNKQEGGISSLRKRTGNNGLVASDFEDVVLYILPPVCRINTGHLRVKKGEGDLSLGPEEVGY